MTVSKTIWAIVWPDGSLYGLAYDELGSWYQVNRTEASEIERAKKEGIRSVRGTFTYEKPE